MPRDSDYEIFGGGRICKIGGQTVAEIIPADERKRAAAPSYGTSQRGFLTGIACRFAKLHKNEVRQSSGYEIFLMGCFDRTLAKKSLVRVLLDHDHTQLKAACEDALELLADESALFFKLSLDRIDPKRADELIAQVTTGTRTEISVGYTISDEETLVIEGQQVRVLKDCTLHDVSLCTRGAVRDTFCVHLADDFDLRAAIKSGRLNSEFSAHRLRRSLRSLATA